MPFFPDACCSICAYFEGQDKQGSCRRRAPQPTEIKIGPAARKAPASAWPTVKQSDWCGDFEHKDHAATKGILNRVGKMIATGVDRVDNWENGMRAKMRQRAAVSQGSDID
jgi:hypothetical protein